MCITETEGVVSATPQNMYVVLFGMTSQKQKAVRLLQYKNLEHLSWNLIKES